MKASAKAEELFDVIDTDKSGTIDADELLKHFLKIGVDADEISHAFAAIDTNSDGMITRDEWRAGYARYLGSAGTRALDADEWTSKGWLKSLPLYTTVAEALGVTGADQFAAMRALSDDELRARLRRAKLEGLYDTIHAELKALRAQQTSTGAALNSKFETEASFEFEYGSLSLFFGGLDQLIGPPVLAEEPGGTRTLMRQMELEHTAERDSRVPFKTSNQMTTTSQVEWEFVVKADPTKPYPEREDLTENREKWRKA